MSESRHLRSVSDLYAADEIEVLLLEEIRDLDPPPAAYSRPEDIQDFEIAGSRTGRRISSQSSELDSPGLHSTIHSWDSHANYHGNYGYTGSSGNTMPWPRTSHIIFYCDIQGHLKTAIGFVRLLLLLSSIACLVTLCSSGTAKISLFMLPLVGRLRIMIFVAVLCLLITALLLFLDISHVVFFFPFNWTRVNAWIFTSLGVSYIIGSMLLILSVLEYSSSWVPRKTRFRITIAAVFGLFCAVLSFVLSWIHGRNISTCHAHYTGDDHNQQLYKPVDTSSGGVALKDGARPKQLPPWVVKNSKKYRASLDSNNGGNTKRKDHWASARDHFLNTSQFDEEMEDPRGSAIASDAVDSFKHGAEIERRRLQQQRRQQLQQRRDAADGTSGTTTGGTITTSQTKTSFSTDESKKKVPSKKLPTLGADKPRPRSSKEPVKKPARTSVTRSEIQEYWMQGYEHVQRTDKTTANIEQWQSAAMKSLEEKKVKDARWAEIWQQQKEQHQKELLKEKENNSNSKLQDRQPLSATSPNIPSINSSKNQPNNPHLKETIHDDVKPCSSKTTEPLNFP